MEAKDIQLGQTITLASGETFKVARVMPGSRYDRFEVYPDDTSADLPPYFELARHDEVTLVEIPTPTPTKHTSPMHDGIDVPPAETCVSIQHIGAGWDGTFALAVNFILTNTSEVWAGNIEPLIVVIYAWDGSGAVDRYEGEVTGIEAGRWIKFADGVSIGIDDVTSLHLS